MGKEQRVNVRVDPGLRNDFDEALELTGLGETQFVKAAIKALVEYVREHGEITLPLALLPKSQLKKNQAAATVRRPSSSTADLRLNEEPALLRKRKAT
jgi:antitoxin component of RelBE/YafQ-DinJ toxin-antitoxin module